MTRTELRKATRLIYHHQKLQEKVEDLRGRLTAYMELNNTTTLHSAGYKVTRNNGHLEIIELPKTDERQLDLIPDYFCLERR